MGRIVNRIADCRMPIEKPVVTPRRDTMSFNRQSAIEIGP